ncbi:hypothetical protein, partial [Clostridium diolis]|uniref:hypothetical protein n=1 Tax=Clostridium diolis TaxID=223919 RepID=UPI001A9BC2DF
NHEFHLEDGFLSAKIYSKNKPLDNVTSKGLFYIYVSMHNAQFIIHISQFTITAKILAIFLELL